MTQIGGSWDPRLRGRMTKRSQELANKTFMQAAAGSDLTRMLVSAADFVRDFVLLGCRLLASLVYEFAYTEIGRSGSGR